MIPIHPHVVGEQWYWNVRCVNKPGLVEEDIRFVSRGIVAHTESIFESVAINGQNYNNVSIGARADGGVAIRQLDEYPTDYRFAIPCTQQQYTAALAYRVAQLGKPYNFIGIGGVLFDIGKPRDWRAGTDWFCSELECANAEYAGFIKVLPSGVNFVTPQDILLILSAAFGLV